MTLDNPGNELRVLMVEDSADDSELLLRALRGGHRRIASRRVDNERDLRAALADFHPHIVLSDYSMPGFSGHEALRLVRELSPRVPFIFVSGTIGEEAAIEAVRRGASDYVFKDNLRRLSTAVESALRKFDESQSRDRMERALRESEERFRAIVESTEDWIWECDPEGRLKYSNAAVTLMLGYAPEDLVGREGTRLVDASNEMEVLRALPRHVAERTGWDHWLLRMRHRDGGIRLIESTARPLFDANHHVAGFRGVSRDVTLRLQQEAKIRQLARIHAVLSALGNAILRARDVPSLLAMACRLAVEQGQFHAAIVSMPDEDGRMVSVQQHGDIAVTDMVASFGPHSLGAEADARRPLVRAFATGAIVTVPDYEQSDLPHALREPSARVGIASQVALPIGSPPWAALALFSSTPQPYDEEELALLGRMAADIDYARDFIANSERLQYLAYRSPETGLPNRAAFDRELRARIDRGPTVVGALELLRVGAGGDARSRNFRDRLLDAVGARMLGRVPPGLYLAHVGGSEFMFACTPPAAVAAPVEALEAWLRECSLDPVVIDGEQIHFALRCGAALAPGHGTDLDTLELAALAALADAARRDRPVSAYSEELNQRAERRRLLERELRTALAEQHFTLYLQPKFDARTRRLTGAEALLRWRHPQQGLISPAEFVPLLEETGLIIPTGLWVMTTTLGILQRWRERGWGGYRIAINVSARELRQEGFLEAYRAAIGDDADHGLDVEVTESLLMQDVAAHVRVLDGLRELGCRIAIDDFGTGYSSLNYLSRLPVDVLKIDQTFTAQIASSPDTLALVTNIIGLAHSLGLRVVAEGVEEEEQEKLLRLLRCDELQGYLLGRPIPVDEFERVHFG